jgi:hypothetical protein
MDLKYLVTATRPRVYLMWAVLLPAGFVATHFYQQQAINILWVFISIVGLGYMYKVMPRVHQMHRIIFAWFVPILAGMIVSGGLFYVHTHSAVHLISHLGAFWLGVMAFGYFWNGLVDRPSGWYWFAAILNAAAAFACYQYDAFVDVQYLVAAIVSAWSMLNLWLFRSDI